MTKKEELFKKIDILHLLTKAEDSNDIKQIFNEARENHPELIREC